MKNKNNKPNTEEISKKEEITAAENTEETKTEPAPEISEPAADTEASEKAAEEKKDENTEDSGKTASPKKEKKKPVTAAQLGKKKRFKHGALSVVLSVLFVAAIVLLNVIFNLLSDRVDISADLSDNSIYSIQDSTAEYLSALEDNISIIVARDETAFENSATSDGARYGKQISEIIKRFASAGSRVTAQYKGLESNPSFFSKYGTDLSTGDIIVESETTGRFVRLSAADYLSPSYYFNGREVSAQEYRQYYMYYGSYGSYFSIEYNAAAEKCLLSAVMNVSDKNPVSVAVVSGDYGATTPSSLVSLLEANAFTVDEIKLSTIESIPEDYDFVIVNAPLYDFTNNDINKLDKWLDNGGKLGKNLFYTAAVNADVLPNLNTFLNEWGIDVQSGYVYQTNTDYGYQMSPTYQQLKVNSSDYSEGVDTTTKAAYGDGLKAIKRLFEEQSSYKTAAIVSTYDGAVIAPFDGLQDFDPSTAGATASYDIIVESNKVVYESIYGTYSRVYALGGQYLIDASFLESQYANNADVILNIFTTAAGKDKVQVDVKPKSYSTPLLEISAAQVRVISIIFVVVIPLLIIAAGIVVIVRRKRR